MSSVVVPGYGGRFELLDEDADHIDEDDDVDLLDMTAVSILQSLDMKKPQKPLTSSVAVIGPLMIHQMPTLSVSSQQLSHV